MRDGVVKLEEGSGEGEEEGKKGAREKESLVQGDKEEP